MAAALRAPSVGFGQLAETVEMTQHMDINETVLHEGEENALEEAPSVDLAENVGINEIVHCEGQETEENIISPYNADEVFRCPCGQCTLDSYLDKGCPNLSSSSFPYLDLSKLDDIDREDLTQKLSNDTNDMINSFAELFNETCISLRRREISVEGLARHALSLGAYVSQDIPKPILSEEEEKLKSSKTIDEAFILLRHHMSFFNYELLQFIIKSDDLCSDDDRERMKKYCCKFDTFCKRKVFEVSPDAIGQSMSSLKRRGRRAFAVLTTKQETEPNLVYVNTAKRKIASLLNLKPSTLHLHRIDKGCLLLLFSVFEFVAQELFPLDQVVVEKLKAEGFLLFTKVKCVCVCVLSLIHI